MPDESRVPRADTRRLSNELSLIDHRLRRLYRACETDEQSASLAAAVEQLAHLRRLVDLPKPGDARRSHAPARR